MNRLGLGRLEAFGLGSLMPPVVVPEPETGRRGGSNRFGLRRIVPDRSSVTREQLIREDEELIALVASAIAEGLIP